MYLITARVLRKTHYQNHRSKTRAIQVPQFLLDANVLGIINEEHATRLARMVIDPLGIGLDVEIDVTRV